VRSRREARFIRMSVSISYTTNPENIRAVLLLYADNPRKPSIHEVAALSGTTAHNIYAILQENLPPERYRLEKALRYSRSKTGVKNPMRGKSGSRHHGYQGVVQAKGGYLQLKVNGRYELLHRHVMAQALGMRRLPSHLDVHHIDKDKENNSLDNLALVTKSGHGKLHAENPGSSKLSLWEQWESGISRLKETNPTLLTDS
jgi:hypothetical protein